MAQDFESAFSTKIMSGSFTNLLSSNSDDAVIGIRFSNLHSGSVTVDAKITRSSKDYHLIKEAPIPSGGSLELIHGTRQFLSNSKFKIVPKVGDFYFFPHYLMHTVYPFKGSDEERRSISFNAIIDENIFDVHGQS